MDTVHPFPTKPSISPRPWRLMIDHTIGDQYFLVAVDNSVVGQVRTQADADFILKLVNAPEAFVKVPGLPS